jgi:hypothetical protein
MKKWVKWTLIGFGGLVVAGAIVGPRQPGRDSARIEPPSSFASTPSSTTATPAPAAAEPASKVSMAGYNRVSNGMTYNQVIAILGPPSEENARNEIPGYETVMYTWSDGGMGNMNAMFQNGRLVQKAQFGLR